jgi:hypothetical protein
VTMFEMEREHIFLALTKLSTELASSEPIHLRLVGGAALTLHGFDRGVTCDIDAVRFAHDRADELTSAAGRVASQEKWPAKWFNFDVSRADAIPALGKLVEWQPFEQIGLLEIELADISSLLAMKLRAGRPGRDTRDIELLIEACEIDAVRDAIDLYAEYFPGDEPSSRTIQLVEYIIRQNDVAEIRAFDEAINEMGPNVSFEKALDETE